MLQGSHLGLVYTVQISEGSNEKLRTSSNLKKKVMDNKNQKYHQLCWQPFGQRSYNDVRLKKTGQGSRHQIL